MRRHLDETCHEARLADIGADVCILCSGHMSYPTIPAGRIERTSAPDTLLFGLSTPSSAAGTSPFAEFARSHPATLEAD